MRSEYKILDVLPYGFNLILESARQRINTLLGRTLARWWRVRVGREVVFRGYPLFRKHPTATITIGAGCKFNSAEWSNNIGLNRRCMISAQRGATVSISNNSGFSATVIAASKNITIGDRVLCGGNCTIVDTDRHPILSDARARGESASAEPINIEDDVFIGMNCFILKGSHIGKGSVIAANSVVTGDIPSQVIAGGSPAKVIRTITPN